MADAPDQANGADRPFRLAGLLALTFVHPGIGQVVGAIDLPVSRESTTDFPYIAGTSFKGALRDIARRHWGRFEDDAQKRGIKLFGETNEAAGTLIVSDIRLLLLPVRSLDSSFRYVTCPQILGRFRTDCLRAGQEPGFGAGAFRDLKGDKAAVTEATGSLFLEELVFTPDTDMAKAIEKVATEAQKLVPEGARQTLAIAKRLAVLHDDDFAWFARAALPVRMRNTLDPDTKTVKGGGLWSEEYLAPETVMYALIGRRVADATPFQRVVDLLEADGRYLQLGGNETVGHGWFQVTPGDGWPEASAPEPSQPEASRAEAGQPEAGRS